MWWQDCLKQSMWCTKKELTSISCPKRVAKITCAMCLQKWSHHISTGLGTTFIHMTTHHVMLMLMVSNWSWCLHTVWVVWELTIERATWCGGSEETRENQNGVLFSSNFQPIFPERAKVWRLFTQSITHAIILCRWCKKLFLNALDMVLQPLLTIKNAPSTLLATVNSQPQYTRWYCNTLWKTLSTNSRQICGTFASLHTCEKREGNYWLKCNTQW